MSFRRLAPIPNVFSQASNFVGTTVKMTELHARRTCWDSEANRISRSPETYAWAEEEHHDGFEADWGAEAGIQVFEYTGSNKQRAATTRQRRTRRRTGTVWQELSAWFLQVFVRDFVSPPVTLDTGDDDTDDTPTFQGDVPPPYIAVCVVSTTAVGQGTTHDVTSRDDCTPLCAHQQTSQVTSQ
jgi:hypothetical protein